MSRKIGYARVSTTGQTLDGQILTLEQNQCGKIFREKISGSNAERPQLNRLLSYIQEGDTVIVTRIDRLARSTFDLFAIIRNFTEKKAHFYSLSEPWADTSSSTGRLMLAVLGGLADVERDLIRTRTAEGRARAQKQGVKMGRPLLTSKTDRIEIINRRQDGHTLAKIAKDYNISPSTVMRIINKECIQ
ncbi:recombinase family protein [Acetobacter orleanensis]|uniref:DNA invertase n=1 Tax=Acetobacter orleanensis TaxID=104099 RepID=A0A4Y3TQJ3_9PROT|nr:recombinase family protein [Acetobacter orleanensis]KXV63048.1 transposase [Acetobacter orleanensis]PCD78799.1 transposase [Acetobacter orleanensis]GAN68789.1 DNA recombinase/resolvase [Acetobacter orleanensis JCM 7639]GBR25977.1 DNA resolvase [Acetobacter orleanensis NRIC 0473]GEB83280.1 DNA invertase [Acetobacter orleanensis]